MNRKILNMALTLTPYNSQCHALSKAMKFLIPPEDIVINGTRTISLEVTDLRRKWILVVNDVEYKRAVGEIINPDIIVCADLNVIISSQDANELNRFLNNGDIEIISSLSDKNLLKSAVSNIDQYRLDSLVERCYSFFKLKPKPRFDIKSVTIEDIKTPRDVDWIRDEAVRLEQEDLVEALRLMEIAHSARPSGPFIRRKIEEYRAALNLT